MREYALLDGPKSQIAQSETPKRQCAVARMTANASADLAVVPLVTLVTAVKHLQICAKVDLAEMAELVLKALPG